MNLGHKTAKAAIWAFFSTAGAKAITLIGLSILARLLAPREFGLLAFAMVYITYVETIGDLGSGMALVYWPDRRNDAAQVTFAVNMVAGLFWCAATMLLAPFIAGFFHAANGAPIVRVLAWSFILKYIGNAHDALAQKDLRFRARFLPDIGLATVSSVIALVLAWQGFGAWSLVWGRLAGVTCRTLLLWIVVDWRPSVRNFPFDLVRPMLHYGRGLIVVNVLAAILYYSDLAIVGRFLGATALGLYQMASKLPETTVIVLLWVFSAVLFPAFARLHAEGEDLRAPYLLATRYVSAITLPAALGLSVLARPIVLLFFGDQWLPAAPILAALAIAAALRCLSTHSGDVLKATGRAPLLARISLLKAFVIVPALLIGARFDATAVAVSLAIAAGVTTLITLTITSRYIGLRMRDMVSAFLPSAAAGVAMATVLLLWTRWSLRLPVVLQLAGGVLLGFCVYVAVLSMIDPELLGQARRFFLGNRRSPEEALRGAAG
ncbi:MAG TPA: lipopolysaccharide biosynthesis protein [Thermoanaerobaculia bacterium]|nr:lipopolysaccharide biosynthesis protein [Thermoanaerobaculia bacterium]